MSALTDADTVIYNHLRSICMRPQLDNRVAEEIADELNKQNLLATSKETK